MSKRKADVRIGYRAVEEVYRISNYSTHYATVLLGCSKKLVYAWAEGTGPSAIYLQRMYEMGADVVYILTGRRTLTL